MWSLSPSRVFNSWFRFPTADSSLVNPEAPPPRGIDVVANSFQRVRAWASDRASSILARGFSNPVSTSRPAASEGTSLLGDSSTTDSEKSFRVLFGMAQGVRHYTESWNLPSICGVARFAMSDSMYQACQRARVAVPANSSR